MDNNELGTNLAEVGRDCISRQAAIDALKRAEALTRAFGYHNVIETIRELPSVQPEIIRCKDCKHWDGVDTCDVIDAPVWDNDFCSMAERKR